MSKKKYKAPMPVGNFFPVPNEILQLGLCSGEILVYTYLMYCEDRTLFTNKFAFDAIIQEDMLVLILTKASGYDDTILCSAYWVVGTILRFEGSTILRSLELTSRTIVEILHLTVLVEGNDIVVTKEFALHFLARREIGLQICIFHRAHYGVCTMLLTFEENQLWSGL